MGEFDARVPEHQQGDQIHGSLNRAGPGIELAIPKREPCEASRRRLFGLCCPRRICSRSALGVRWLLVVGLLPVDAADQVGGGGRQALVAPGRSAMSRPLLDIGDRRTMAASEIGYSPEPIENLREPRFVVKCLRDRTRLSRIPPSRSVTSCRVAPTAAQLMVAIYHRAPDIREASSVRAVFERPLIVGARGFGVRIESGGPIAREQGVCYGLCPDSHCGRNGRLGIVVCSSRRPP